MLNKLIRHVREGTWAEGISIRMNRWLEPYITSAKQKAKEREGVHRFYIQNCEEGVIFLADQAGFWHSKKNGSILVAGSSDDSYFISLCQRLRDKGLDVLHFYGNGASHAVGNLSLSYSCILSAFFNEKDNFQLVKMIQSNEALNQIPFEYVGDALLDYKTVKKHNLHTSLHFISPLLIDAIPYFEIYEESLLRFEKKCDIRDYMDLCQAIAHVSRHGVTGDVCEFGSYKGHSGYLISKLLEAEKSEKQLYMFDMFEHFPDETAGVDAFWSQTHHVDFNEVKSKFTDRKNVRLIKGDFTQTLSTVKLDKLSLIYVDCDSYRATLFLMKELFEQKLSEKGMMIFEDYGHPALLGNRLAIHEFFEGRKDCITFFSQFSGYYIVIKTS
ncbi:MAG: hypothetical protein RIT43_498 [Bacteroidota bacterium]|jgi:hypothetical protein